MDWPIHEYPFEKLEGKLSMENVLEERIGKRIATIRVNQKITQNELAKELGVSTKHISEVERGLSSLSLEKLVKVGAFFDCSMDYLIKGEEQSQIMEALPSGIREIMMRGDEEEKRMLNEYLKVYGHMKNTFYVRPFEKVEK